MRSPFPFLLPALLVGLAGCGGSDPTPQEGASADAVEATVNNANAILEQAENRSQATEENSAKAE